jgi:DNA excision repair protein ERCC-2
MQLSEFICRMAEEKRDAIVDAPSGFGKTAAALAAAYSMISDYGWGVVYAVRTRRQVDRVMEEASRFREISGTRTSPMIGMSDGCLLKRREKVEIPRVLLPAYCKTNVSWGSCEYFGGLTERTVWEIPQVDSIDSALSYGELLRVCPYMLSRRVAGESGVVVITYSHLTEPFLRNLLVSYRRNWHDWVLVVDEAHNLPDSLYEAQCYSLSLSEMSYFRNLALKRGDKGRGKLANSIVGMIQSLHIPEGGEMSINISEEKLVSPALEADLLQFSSDAGWLPYLPQESGYLASLARFSEFLTAWSMSKGRNDSRLIVSRTGNETVLKVCRFDISLDESLRDFRSRIFMTATPGTLASFVGGAVKFSPEYGSLDRRCITLVWPDVSTEYSSRTPEMIQRISAGLMNLTISAKGRFVTFLPSYGLVQSVSNALGGLNDSGVKIYMERPSISATEQKRLVQDFLSSKVSLLLGVAGGSFSEGEDFSEGALSGVGIVGLPLAPPSTEARERLDYFSRKVGHGRAYDLLVLGQAVSKVVQAAGRIFRTPGRLGLVVLMDRRYLQRRISNNLPSWMRENLYTFNPLDSASVSNLLHSFGFDV